MKKKDKAEFDKDPAAFIKAFIENRVETGPENRLHMIDDSPIFDPPLIGFADGDDPLFREYKERIIGSFHMTPREVIKKSMPPVNAVHIEDMKDISVICWVLPLTKRTRASNANREVWPSLRWGHTRYYGEKFNEWLRRELVSMLTGQGYFAVAPVLSPAWKWWTNDSGGPVSNWSERHALYVAGLGTFGLSDGFITPKGKAIRCGSVITDLPLPSTNRPYKTHTDNCPFYRDMSCGVCIDRCPAGAITKKGHNKILCHSYLRDHIGHIKKWYGAEPAGCGLCQTGVPCEHRIPSPARKKHQNGPGS